MILTKIGPEMVSWSGSKVWSVPTTVLLVNSSSEKKSGSVIGVRTIFSEKLSR